MTLIVVTILIVWAMLIFVVPTFQEMYAGMGIELPGPTQMIINASDWIMDGELQVGWDHCWGHCDPSFAHG